MNILVSLQAYLCSVIVWHDLTRLTSASGPPTADASASMRVKVEVVLNIEENSGDGARKN